MRVEQDAEVTAEAEEPGTQPGDGLPSDDGPGPRATRRRQALVVVAVALVVGGALFLLRAAQLTGAPAADNRALTDTEATARVTGDVGNALTAVFSYRPGHTDATRASARELLAGKAARQYTELFGQVEKRAAEQKLTLTTHVVRVGVTRLTGGSARLLVFLDQVSQRQGGAPATAPAQLSVTAELDDGRWRIVGIASR
ncbi:hypothetical protein AB0903_23540 [Streptomyces sp. NPDC048389]|uniref:hypothetical protein n=1 Tax=Streptomyces sp. NPDC048389 TaxID=3154622 RepID=UPI0034571557